MGSGGQRERSTFLPKVVLMCWNSTKWWFFAKIVVGMTSFPTVGVSDFRQGSPIPTRKLEICWSPTIFPNNGKGRCTAERQIGPVLYTLSSVTGSGNVKYRASPFFTFIWPLVHVKRINAFTVCTVHKGVLLIFYMITSCHTIESVPLTTNVGGKNELKVHSQLHQCNFSFHQQVQQLD